MKRFFLLLLIFAGLGPAWGSSPQVRLLTLSQSDSLTKSELTERIRIGRILQPVVDTVDSVLVMTCTPQEAKKKKIAPEAYDYINEYVRIVNLYLNDIRNVRIDRSNLPQKEEEEEHALLSLSELTISAMRRGEPIIIDVLILIEMSRVEDGLMVLNCTWKEARRMGISQERYDKFVQELDEANRFFAQMELPATDLHALLTESLEKPVCIFYMTVNNLGEMYAPEAYERFMAGMEELTARTLEQTR